MHLLVEKVCDKLDPKFYPKLCYYETFFSTQDCLYYFLHYLSLDAILDNIDIDVLKKSMCTYLLVGYYMKIMWETVMYNVEKSLFVYIYRSNHHLSWGVPWKEKKFKQNAF